MVRWIAMDLRTKQGDHITARKDSEVWTINQQFAQTMESTAVHNPWKVN